CDTDYVERGDLVQRHVERERAGSLLPGSQQLYLRETLCACCRDRKRQLDIFPAAIAAVRRYIRVTPITVRCVLCIGREIAGLPAIRRRNVGALHPVVQIADTDL